ncbi:MAG: TonB-dependent receptor [Cyclobacteriaceae bacterium]|nr:TonB-dependent receptor [Cyclobacteriaceae bacterium]
MKLSRVCTLLFIFGSLQLIAQVKTVPLKDAFNKVEKNHQVKFFYKNSWINEITVDESSLKLQLPEFLALALDNNGLPYKHYGKHIILLKPDNNKAASAQNQVTYDENPVFDGKEYSISGKITEANTGESIVGASVFIQELKTGTTSNALGFYSITLPSGMYNFQFSAAGKAASSQRIVLNKPLSLNIELYDHLTQLNEVVVKAEAMDRNISSIDIGLVKLDAKALQKMPAFMGTADVIKSITLLPGVSTVGEGAAGFNVRGGNVDQNLILLDEVPLFNSSHLLGFYSIINADEIKDMTLYKGGIPSQYGGRISSVLDIRLKDGNSKKFSGKGNLGMISSGLSLEGPIIKDKTSFSVGGRYAYPNWILKRIPDYNIRNSEAYFYDLNATINHQINQKNSIRLSSYLSEDGFKFAADTLYGWQTKNLALKWSTLPSEKIFLSTTLISSDYSYQVEGQNTGNEYTADFGIKTVGAKVDGSYFASLKHKIDFGISTNFYSFNPGSLVPAEGSSLNRQELETEKSIESAIYIGDEIKFNSRFTIQAGVRYSLYSFIGPKEVFIYDPSFPKSPSTIIDTVSYNAGEIIKTYSGIEPRASLKFSLNNTSSVKVGYHRAYQYLHLISNTTAISPLDIWKSSDQFIKPQIGDQYSAGYFKNFLNNVIETSVELYYKEIQNMVDYKDGANLFLNPFLETQLLPAFGKAYGIELFIRKNSGNLTGWLGYTYSRSLRKVSGSTREETINLGEYFPSNFDKPHDLSTVLNYKFNRRFSISSNFTYSTGRPITYPDAVFIVDGYSVVQFSERNTSRIPDYNRLDLAFILDESLNKTRKWKGSWTLSIYNVYGRKNPYSIFFQPNFKGSLAQAYRLSVLGTVFPSLTYNFRF